MDRFFIQGFPENDRVVFSPADGRHMRSLRLGVGDWIEGVYEGFCHKVRIEKVEKDGSVVGVVCEKSSASGESPVVLHLYQGLPKSDKMDWIVQKSVEVGAVSVTPFHSSRTVAALKEDRKIQKRLERWNAIARQAAMQSKRGIIPSVHSPLSFEELLEVAKGKKTLVAYEGEEHRSVGAALADTTEKCFQLIIGPEGGFSEEEIRALESCGAVCVGLGPRILRTETAGIVLMTLIQGAIGDMNEGISHEV